MQQFFEQLKQLWTRSSAAWRMMFVGVPLTVLALIAWLSLSEPDYVPLYTNLPIDELGAVKAKLDATQTTYRMVGSSVMVPATQFDKLRVEMATSGLPAVGGAGFELFDKTQIGMSPFVQTLNHTRAIQGELERTIKLIDPVRQVRVMIVQPDPTPFARDQKPVTASVLVTPKSGANLSQSQVDGIVALVSASVKGLQRDQVTVVDATTSKVLSKRPDDPTSNVSSEQLAHQREVENHLAGKAQDMLDRILGYGKAVVRVTADMKFQHLRETQEIYNPEGRALVEEHVTNSKTTGAQQPSGVAGAASNLSPVVPASFTASEGNSQDEAIESKWLVSKSARQSEQKVGSIERITVAVMLVAPKAEDGKKVEESLGLSLPDAELLVKRAVGFKEGRDAIQVSLGTPLPEGAYDTGTTPTTIDQVMKGAYPFAIVIVALTFLFMVISYSRRQNRRLQIEAERRAAMAGEDLRNLEMMAEALRTWVDNE